MKLKKILIKLKRLRQIVCVVVSTTLEHWVSQVVGMGKGDVHANKDFSLIWKVNFGKFQQDRNVGQHQILQLVHFLIFLNFQNHREHIYNYF